MDQQPMTSGWYFAKAGNSAGKETGPFSWEQLYHMARTDTLGPDDLVWNPRLPRGVAARLVPGLFPGLAKPGVPVAESISEAAPEPEPLTLEALADQPEHGAAGTADTKEAKHQRRKERRPPETAKPSSRLPLLVVLLVLVVAAAGLTAYFVFFRSTIAGSENDQLTRMGAPAAVIAAAPASPDLFASRVVAYTGQIGEPS